LEGVGRRWQLFYGGLWCSVWLFVFCHRWGRPQSGHIVTAYLFILSYASTWAPGI
ncbi:hypothetical protein K437DRAFT_229427, partial [Tilletiaria anomala UBC 951]